jgi:transcription initiation factor TFIID TATA-box-binding protein
MSETDNNCVEVVNVVGSGAFGVEIDIEALSADIPEAEYDPENYHGMYLRVEDDAPLTTLYRSGKYIITGANSTDELFRIRERIIELLHEFGIIEANVEDGFSVQNFVCQADLNQDINLSRIAIGLGLEKTEYEPEQFPGLVYRPPEHDCVILVFGSGKVIVTGASDLETAQHAFDDFESIMTKYNK